MVSSDEKRRNRYSSYHEPVNRDNNFNNHTNLDNDRLNNRKSWLLNGNNLQFYVPRPYRTYSHIKIM